MDFASAFVRLEKVAFRASIATMTNAITHKKEQNSFVFRDSLEDLSGIVLVDFAKFDFVKVEFVIAGLVLD